MKYLKPSALGLALLAPFCAGAQTAPGNGAATGVVPPHSSAAVLAPAVAPAIGPNAGVSALLNYANQALEIGNIPKAEGALEQAETRILQRAVPPGQTNYVSHDPVVEEINHARHALINHDKAAAHEAITHILASSPPELRD